MLNFRNSLVHRDSAAGHQQLPAGQHPDDQLTATQLHMDILPGGADAQLGQSRHGGAGAGAAGPGLAAAAFPHPHLQVGGIHHLDMGTLLDRLGIAVRTGHHCAEPLMRRLGVEGTVRASFGLYNTRSEVDALAEGIERVAKMF